MDNEILVKLFYTEMGERLIDSGTNKIFCEEAEKVRPFLPDDLADLAEKTGFHDWYLTQVSVKASRTSLKTVQKQCEVILEKNDRRCFIVFRDISFMKVHGALIDGNVPIYTCGGALDVPINEVVGVLFYRKEKVAIMKPYIKYAMDKPFSYEREGLECFVLLSNETYLHIQFTACDFRAENVDTKCE